MILGTNEYTTLRSGGVDVRALIECAGSGIDWKSGGQVTERAKSFLWKGARGAAKKTGLTGDQRLALEVLSAAFAAEEFNRLFCPESNATIPAWMVKKAASAWPKPTNS